MLPFPTEHELVRVYKIRLRYLHELNGDNQRDGDESAHENDVAEKHQHGVCRDSLIWPVDVIVALLVMLSEEPVAHRWEYAEEKLKEENADQEAVKGVLKS